MAKHDIVVLNSTSSGFETDLGNNIARIKGNADDLFSVKDGSGTDKLSVSTLDGSMIISGGLTLTGNISASVNSTGSFGRIDVTNLIGDASQMTNVDQRTHVSSSKQLAARISGAFTAGFEVIGNISGSSTSTGSFTRVFSNNYSGDASQMTNVPIDTGTLSGSKQIASQISGSFNKGFDLSSDSEISGSATSTGSFRRLNVLGTVVGNNFLDVTGVASALPSGVISSSIPIASQISGAFTSGFEVTQDSVHGTGNVISHSASATGSVTGSLISKGFFISGSVTSTGSFGHFNMGDYGGFGTNSILSSGSEVREPDAAHGGKITILDTSELTGLDTRGFISSSGQIAAYISGAFTSGFGFGDPIGTTFANYPYGTSEAYPTASINIISGSATSTGSFGRLDNISKIVADASDTTGLTIPTGAVSSSIQIATRVSGSFNKGFEFDNSISGSATSTGSFGRINFNNLNATDISGITGHESGHLTGAGDISAQISGAFTSGFNLDGTISGSSASSLKIQNLELSGSFTFANTKFTKNWDGSFVRTATFGNSLGDDISGSFDHGFSFQGTISGSSTSTGSFSQIRSKELFVKQMVGVRKPISGSMGHDTYISGSYKTDSHAKVVIPVRGRVDHTMVTKQFTSTGSMESQKYRNQPGQLFVDNWGRLNMTVQTGSLVAQPAAWTLVGSGEAMGGRSGGMIGQSTKAALVLPSTGFTTTETRIFNGITVTEGASLICPQYHCGWSHAYQGIGNGVDDGLFAGGGFGGGMGKHGQFYNGIAWSVLPVELPVHVYSSNGQPKAFNAPGVTTNGGGAIVGGISSNKVFEWTGVSWEIGGTRNVCIGGGGAAGTVYAGLAFGGDEFPQSTACTCTEEYNGVSWSTANAMPHGLDTVGAGTQNAAAMAGGATVAPHAHGAYNASDDTFEYNGTSWNTSVDMLNRMQQHNMTGGTGTLISGPGLEGWSNGIGAIFEPGFVTGSAQTYNKFSQNASGEYLLTKKLQANYSPGIAGGGTTSNNEDDFGGGY